MKTHNERKKQKDDYKNLSSRLREHMPCGGFPVNKPAAPVKSVVIALRNNKDNFYGIFSVIFKNIAFPFRFRAS